ncbi:MAG: spermidine/putrescine ABC transporter ATP-binding protein [Phycisphaeraceae bacterium]|nr:spermidine/putrescine ABC transporter ATP-binding protein [Phycisphaeraceae bacterium]
MVSITLAGLRKCFGATVAVDGVDLSVDRGNLFFLLGPSGCGKTTLLRMIAGFTEPTAGSIQFDGKDVTCLAANRRSCGMVFQNYALWPHMSVRQNVGFGLEVRKVRGQSKMARIDQALDRVKMGKYAHRKPNELSGGQQQRVALARALVIEPSVLLLDEPLSNLDARLRLELRGQIKQICKEANITTVYVTHDQDEALSMADTIAVFNAGKVIQMGTPHDLYRHPQYQFVADFLGDSNFLPAQIAGRDGDTVILNCKVGRLRSSTFPKNVPTTGSVTCSIRPGAIRITCDRGTEVSDQVNHIANVQCHQMTYLGETGQYEVTVDDSLPLRICELNPALVGRVNKTLDIEFDSQDVVILND